ncbi:MAG: hypothetical protein QMC09_07605, partial [Thauera sp.]
VGEEHDLRGVAGAERNTQPMDIGTGHCCFPVGFSGLVPAARRGPALERYRQNNLMANDCSSQCIPSA